MLVMADWLPVKLLLPTLTGPSLPAARLSPISLLLIVLLLIDV